MPLPTNTSRPSLPYIPAQSLPNNQRFDLLGKRPPTAEMLDAEFNALQDNVNRLAQAINDVQAGAIPGSDDPRNAEKVLKTDGQGTLSFTLVTNTQLARNGVVEANLAPQSVTTPKIGDGAVTSAKLAPTSVQTNNLADGSVTTPKLADGGITPPKLAVSSVQTNALADSAVTTPKLGGLSVTTVKIAALSVTAAKLANNAVTTDKIANLGVTTDKLANVCVTNPKVGLKAVQVGNIDAQAAARGAVLLTTGNGNTSFAKVASASFDASLLSRGTVLGSLDGNTLAPVGGLIFAGFYVVSAREDGSNFVWRGFNVQNATCVPDFDFGALTFTVTYRRQATVGNVFAFVSYNTLNLTANATGFAYATPSNSPGSYVYFAFLPDGN